MKYIDAEKLISEIDSILSSCTKQTHTGVFNTCTHFKGLIASLQQEVDLEKEAKRWWKEHLHLNPENKLWMDAHQSVVFARHFYELGLNARKEE